jgi:hypothetical protein
MRQTLDRLQQSATKVTASNRFGIGLAMLVACCFVFACAKPEQPKQQESPAPQIAEASPPRQISLAPTLPEVQEAVRRIFKDAALVNTDRNPNFVEGDFNGDRSQDIAIVLKPAPGKLSKMNEELPAWILKDPFVAAQPGMPPLRVTENETLLAVVHGYGVNGWRDPQATQTYLLKNAVGPDVKTQPKSEFLIANQGKQMPRLPGDLIGEVLRGRAGYLYFAEVTYSWYDPKSFKGEPETRLVHAGAAARPDKPNLFSLRPRKQVAAEK